MLAIGRYSQLVDAIVRVWHAWIGWVACEPGMARNRFAVPVIKNIYRPLVMGPGLLLVLWFSLWVFLVLPGGGCRDCVGLSRRFADPDRGHTRGPRTVQQKRSKQSGHVRAGWFVADDVNDEER